MSYKCEILADSINEQGHRLTTFKVTYPRIIHAEMLRHRMLSRNVASSRAIPFKKMVKDVEEDPFIPIAWQKDHKGMQGSEYITDKKLINRCKEVWLHAKDNAVERACELHGDNWIEPENKHLLLDVTKQLCNRLLEPFMWVTELVSGTEWENFFELRCPKYHYDLEDKYFRSKKDWLEYYKKTCIGDVNSDFTLKEEDWFNINKSQAEIHIQKIAEMMWDAYNESKPKTLQSGEWHIPYGDNISNDVSLYSSDIKEQARLWGKDLTTEKLKIATARAARISYTTLGDNPKIDYEADIKLHDKLLKSKHLSCFEHCARVMSEEEYESFYKGERVNKEHTGLDENKGWCNNYHGFIQYRYFVENQYVNTSKFNM